MRYYLAVMVGMVVVMCGGYFSRRCVGEGAGERTVKVSLAVVEVGLTNESALHVIIENVSQKPQKHFAEWNSWGYYNLTLEWRDEEGKTGTVSKVARGWTRNGPGTVVVGAGEALVRDISFDPKEWMGWPEIRDGMKLKVKVTYHVAEEPKGSLAEGWTGTEVSSEQEITVWKVAGGTSEPGER